MDVQAVVNDVHAQVSTLKVKSSFYIVTAAALTVGMAWNTAVKDAVDYYYPLKRNNVQANFVFALIVTILLLIVIYFFTDADKELPAETQQKITEVRIANMEKRIDELQKENKLLRSGATQRLFQG